ncbi:MAG: hypothetical protein LBD41_04050 [Clostridiales Family XIII bacterium]|jgi:hypothetical protein|nr:hypothetical protein [Clostridiales Family XIII bacterium]
MAECDVLQEVSESVKSKVNSVALKETCFYCAELELELKQTQLELKSYENTVNLLCNDIKTREENDLTHYARGCKNKCNNFDHKPKQCLKCMDLSKKYQEAQLEIRSLQFINKLLYKELNLINTKYRVRTGDERHVQEDDLTLPTQYPVTTLECMNKWTEFTLMDHPTSRNCYEVSVPDISSYAKENNIITSDNNSETSNNNQTENCMKTIHREDKSKSDMMTYLMPNIINGKLSSNVGEPVCSMRSLYENKKLYLSKDAVANNRLRHKILIIGDSHVRDLAGNINSRLSDTFNVMGSIKPNADIEGITSSLHTSEEYFTKKDVIIFCGGTKDISKNESRKGLYSLKAFIQRTDNTNVILLRVPLRYDLSPESCVDIEVKRFNKRLQSLANNFDHVNLVNVSTERIHHTKHGLHLNNKGKD